MAVCASTIIGMTIVLADGTIARNGGKVVKNVAGYNLHKLLTGAFGTLGIITEVNFRLHSVPRHNQTLSISTNDAAALAGLMLTLLGSQLSIVAMQLRGDSGGFHLDLELNAMPEILNIQSAAVAELADQLGLPSSPVGNEIWLAREHLFNNSGLLICKAAMLPSAVASHTITVRSLNGICVTQAVGVMIAAIPLDAASEVLAWRASLEALGGSLTNLRKPDIAAIPRRGTPPDTMPLMRQIKYQFDPRNTLNPGSFMGGIS